MIHNKILLHVRGRSSGQLYTISEHGIMVGWNKTNFNSNLCQNAVHFVKETKRERNKGKTIMNAFLSHDTTINWLLKGKSNRMHGRNTEFLVDFNH